MSTNETTTSAPRLGTATRMGAVELTVSNLERSVDYYQRSIGLQVHRQDEGTAALGAGGEDLLLLREDPSAVPAGRHAGLYHFALLHPSRLELARAAQRLAVTRTPIEGASDHGISEAIYLPDPDGNGIELAADRPREVWPDLSDPGWDMGPKPLDLHGLLGLVSGEEPQQHADPGLVVGHVHLHVSDLEEARAFYGDVLGLDVMTELPSALFMAGGGYHHHVGLNVWRGRGIPPMPESGTVGLGHFTLVLDPQDADGVRDRALSAGLAAERTQRGTLLRDPHGMHVLILATPGEATSSTAVVETEHASGYVQRLAKHFGHKIEGVQFDETHAVIPFSAGSAELDADGNRLTIEVRAETPEGRARVEWVVESHLLRFAFREGLDLRFR
jgi:catechol 2,3-dioxygenase